MDSDPGRSRVGCASHMFSQQSRKHPLSRPSCCPHRQNRKFCLFQDRSLHRGRSTRFDYTLALVAFHLHLLEDLVGSRGRDGFNWPIPYLFPFSNRWICMWGGQWKVDAWPNIAFTIALLFGTVWMAVKRGFSPLDIFSPTADRSVVAALRKRFRTTDLTA